MALLDRFRTQPRQSHADPAVRLAYVEDLPIDERDELVSIARGDDDPRVRSAAVAKLLDPPALALVAREDRDPAVRDVALQMLRDIALEAFEGLGEAESFAAVDVLSDAKALMLVAKTASRERVAARALSLIGDARALGAVARHAALEPIRRAALDRLQDREEIIGVAMHTGFKDTALAALDRLSDRADLQRVAARATNKSAASRARAMLRDLDARAAAEASEAAALAAAARSAAAVTVPVDPVQRASAERLRIVLALEAASQAVFGGTRVGAGAVGAGTVDDAGTVELGQAERFDRMRSEAQTTWSSLPGTPDSGIAERFAAADLRLQANAAEARILAEAKARAHTEREHARLADETARRVLAEQEAARRVPRLTDIAEEAARAADESDLGAARRRLNATRREWADLASGVPVDPGLAARFAEAGTRLAAREAEARERDEWIRRQALAGLQQLLACVEPVLKHPGPSLKAADHALRDVRAALASMPPLPSRRDYEDMTRQLKAVQAALAPKVQELREADEWRRFANVAIQEQLCARMEALSSVADPDAAARQVRDLQRQWREAADVPRGQAEALWRRFKTAHDEVWSRLEAHVAAQAEARGANLARKLALCERAEALADSTNWLQTAEEIKGLQAQWKSIGPAARGQEKAVWDRFRSACDRFFTRRHEDLARRKAMWAQNLARKDALCVRVEALVESTEWEPAASEIKRLQAEWRTIGPVKKTRSEAIWQRFRGACDRFFARYAQRHDLARAERVAAREALCAELEALAQGSQDGAPAADLAPTDLADRVRAIRRRWQQEIAARGVDREMAAGLDRRFETAFDAVLARWPASFTGTELDAAANRRRMEALVTRVEELAASVAPAVPASGTAAGAPPGARLAEMLKEALAANTIAGRSEIESRSRAALDDMRQAQASWTRIGPVPAAVRRIFDDRFQRACHRIVAAAGGGASLPPAPPAKSSPRSPSKPVGRAG